MIIEEKERKWEKEKRKPGKLNQNDRLPIPAVELG